MKKSSHPAEMQQHPRGHAAGCPKCPRRDQCWHCGPRHGRTCLARSGGGRRRAPEPGSCSAGLVVMWEFLKVARLFLKFVGAARVLSAGCRLWSTARRGLPWCTQQQGWMAATGHQLPPAANFHVRSEVSWRGKSTA